MPVMTATHTSRPTLRRLFHAMVWFCVCFALTRHLLPSPFVDFDPPPGSLGGQTRMYYCGALPILGALFGAGAGAIFGKTGLGALVGIPTGFVLAILLSDPHYN